MLSRDADACFWIGRYIERAEATARMIDVHYHFGLELPSIGETLSWSSILSISGGEEAFHARYGVEDERSILRYFIFDEANSDSIYSSIRSARECARAIREQLSSEMWESLNATFLEMRSWTLERVLEVSPHEFFQRIKNASHLFQGILNRTLMMGESRDFLDAGRFLERGGQTARILDVKYHVLLPKLTKSDAAIESVDIEAQPALPEPDSVGGPVDVHGWISVLKSVGAFEAYRKTYQRGVTPANVASFLILNNQFPASVRHCVGRVEAGLRRISGNTGRGPVNAAEREVGRLHHELNYLTADEIISRGLHEFLQDVLESCAGIGNAITEIYLRY